MSATQTDQPRGHSIPERSLSTETVIASDTGHEPATSGDPEAPFRAPSASSRWWVGVAVGGLVTCPLAWLLSYAATLPFFIGVFFFAVFGLIIGASVYRVAASKGRYAHGAVLLGTTLLVLFGWGTSVVLESARFPADVGKFALEKANDIGDRTAAEFRADIAERTQQHLADRFPPGGLLGYAKWSLLSGRLTPGDIPGLRRPFRSGQAKFWWGIRVALSIGLLAFGVGSQTLPLSISARNDQTDGTTSSA